MTDISAAMVKELRDATSAGMMDCKRALAGDGRRLRRGGQAPAREGHGVRREARRPRDERGQGRRDGRDNVGAIAAIGCETEPVSKNDDFLALRREGARAVFDGGDAASSLEEERVELAAKLGENIQVVGAKRIEAADRRGAVVLRPPAGEQGRRARAHEGRRSPEAARSSRCTSRSRGRRTGRATRCRRSSSTPSARSSPSPTRCSRSRRTCARRSSKGMLNKRFFGESVLTRADLEPRRRGDRHGRAGPAEQRASSSSTTPGTRSAVARRGSASRARSSASC